MCIYSWENDLFDVFSLLLSLVYIMDYRNVHINYWYSENLCINLQYKIFTADSIASKRTIKYYRSKSLSRTYPFALIIQYTDLSSDKILRRYANN